MPNDPDTNEALQPEIERLRQRVADLEQQLSERTIERDLFKAVVENSPDTISVAGLDRTITYANPAFCSLMGYGDALIGMSARDLYAEPPHRMDQVFEHVRTRGFWHGVLTYRRQDGSTFSGQLTTFVIRDEQGQPQAMAGIARDISDRLQLEELLWQNRSFLQGLLDNSPAAIYVKDTLGRLILINQRYRNTLHLEVEQIIGKTETELFPPEIARTRQDSDRQVLQTGRLVEGEEFISFDDGMHVFMSIKFPIFDAHNNLSAIGCISHDITRMKQAEEENAYLQDQVIVAQYIALRDVSSPLCPLTDDALLMPLVGAIDSARAQHIMEQLLEGIAQQQASIAILDITGVPVVDTQVAQILLQTAQAVRLLGARVVLTGISPAMARALVQLDVDVQDIVTHSSLQAGIADILL